MWENETNIYEQIFFVFGQIIPNNIAALSLMELFQLVLHLMHIS